MKVNKIFECSKCGAQFPRWEGRCRECGAWSTLQESQVKLKKNTTIESSSAVSESEILSLSQVVGGEVERIATGEREIDRVLGGGLVPGSLSLLGGDPGIGKSTLVLKIASLFSGHKKSVFYIAGEESASQLKLRVDKMRLDLANVRFINNNEVETIAATLRKYQPQLAVIDSIQTIVSNESESEAGSISQVKIVTAKLMELAKQDNIIILIIGHVTKGGRVAGPKTMEHLVDLVLYLEGEKISSYRLLRCVKNRFGSTGEVGIFKMTSQGLEAVVDPAGIFLSPSQELKPGIVTSVIWEGSRPFMVEIQALVAKTSFGYPKRTASGIELNRLQVLLAVLGQQAGIKFDSDDVYINLAGGLKAKDSGLDLAIAMSLVSAKKNTALKKQAVAIGEVSLTGEIKSIPNLDKRVKEAVRLGYKQIIIPKSQIKITSRQVDIITVENIKQAIKKCLGVRG